MAQVHFDSDSRIFSLEKTANEILNELVPLERLQYCDLFFHARKIGRDEKLADVKGMEPGKTLRILERKSTMRDQQVASKDINEKAVQIAEYLKKLSGIQERIIVEKIWKSDYIENLLKEYPVITEQPALMNVLTDFSLITAMLHEEHGFIQQHPAFVTIVQKLITEPGWDDDVPYRDYVRQLLGGQPPAPGAQPPRLPSFTSEMLQQALAQSLVGNVPSLASDQQGAGPSAFMGIPSNADVAQPGESQEPMETQEQQPTNPQPDYSAENAQLHDLGFTNDQENFQALIVSDGNLEGAIEYIVTTRAQMDDLD